MKYMNVLKNRNLTIYLTGQIVSVFSDGLFKISAIWTIVENTDSAAPIAVMLLVSYLPQLLVGIIGGYLVDKYDRKRILIISDLISGAALAALFAVFRIYEYSFIAFVAIRFVLSLMDVFYSPAAMAYIPRIVDKDDLPAANSLSAAIRQGATIASFGLSGLIIGRAGMNSVLLMNCFSYLFAALMISLIPVNGKVVGLDAPGRLQFSELSAGLQYITKDRFVIQFMGIVFMLNIVYDVFYNLSPLYAKDVLGKGAGGYGALQTALSAGMLAGAFLIGLFRVRKAGRLLIVSILGCGATLFGLSMSRYFSAAILLYFLFAMMDGLSIPCFTYLQLHVEDSIKGRVFAMFDTVVLFATPMASLILGFAVEWLGIPNTYLAAGLMLLIAGMMTMPMGALKRAELSGAEPPGDFHGG